MLRQSIQSSQVPTEQSCEFRKVAYAYLLDPHGRGQDPDLLHDSLLPKAFAWEVEEQSSESASDKK